MFDKAQWQRDYRAVRLASGLCTYGKCNLPVVDGRKSCADHLSEKSRNELKKRLSFPYRPPSDLLPINAFCRFPVADLAYAAALMEGEGAFVLITTSSTGRKPQAILSMKMTDEEPIRWMCSTFGGRVVICPAYGTRKQTWAWKISGRRAGAVCAAIYKYMKAYRRKKQAAAIIRVASVCGWLRKCSVDARGLKIIEGLQRFYLERRYGRAA